MNKTHITGIIFIIFASCTVHPPLTLDTARATLAPVISADSIKSVTGSGEILLAQNGEQLSLSFDLAWQGDASFSAQFYGPMGMNLASIKSVTATRWLLQAGDSQYTQAPSQNIRVGSGFLEYPLTWAELVAALTSRFPCRSDLSSRPDSMYIDKKGILLLWRGRSYAGRSVDISALADNKTYRLAEIIYQGTKNRCEELIFSGFSKGSAKEIKFVSSSGNYFYVKYHTLTIRTRKAS
ncbi:MAG TPA: hypothetical protein VLX68_01295 [Chitinivibrionales bacterium]|nr:hypothetical protein [Chitinivibrionales bacterium]